MTAAVIIEDELTYSRAPSSRVIYLTKELLKKGIPTILIGQKPIDKDIGTLKEYIIPMRCLTGGRVGKMLFRFQMIIEISRVIRKKKIKYVIIRGYWLGIFLLPFMKIFGVKVIYDFHGYVFEEQIKGNRRLRAKSTRIFEWFILKYSDNILSITKSLCKHLPKSLQKKTLLLPNGVDIEKISLNSTTINYNILEKYNIPQNKKLIGFIGNWEKWMNIEDLIKTSRYLEEEQIVIIGEGKNIEIYKKEHPEIIFTGGIKHDEAIRLLKKMDICILPYSKDPILKHKSARKTLEYLAAGKPIVVSDVVGKEDFLVDKENCLVYEPGNSKDLTEKVEKLLGDEKLRKKMSKNNLKLAEEFTWDKVVETSGLLEIIKQ